MPYAERAKLTLAKAPRITEPKLIATADLWDDSDGAWYVSIEQPRLPASRRWRGDLGPYDTAGDALNAYLKWAKDRALTVALEAVTFKAIRPGKVIE